MLSQKPRIQEVHVNRRYGMPLCTREALVIEQLLLAGSRWYYGTGWYGMVRDGTLW